VKYSTNSTEFVWFLGQKYDVSSSEAFGPDGLFHPYIGQDITLLLATNGTADGTAPESYDKSSSPRAFTFTYEEQKRLHHFREIFTREFPVVLDTNKENISEIAPLTSSLHELLDNDVESQTFIEEIRKELVNSNKNTINAVCPRTGLSLLHKAVEKNRLDLVKVLVEEANADTCANASLYDDDTPLELAKRFRLQEICQYLTTSTVD
jgi:hypothetical protein